MSKEPTVFKMETLTEQWKNGELEEDFYYVKNKACLGVEIDYYHVLHSGIKYWSGCDDEDIEEILAPVPTYAEFKDLMSNLQYIDKCRELTEKANQFSQLAKKVEKLEKQLDIAVNTLEVIERMSDKFDNSLGFIEQLDCIKAECQETLYYLKEINEALR